MSNSTDSSVERGTFEDQLLALVIRSSFGKNGIHFFTPDTFSQQVANMRLPEEKVIVPHIHNPVETLVEDTQEVLLIQKDWFCFDFYSIGKNYLESRILEANDLIILCSGGQMKLQRKS